MSTPFTTSRWKPSAGAFLCLILVIFSPSLASEIPDICLSGYPSLAKQVADEPPYIVNAAAEDTQMTVQPSLQQWLSDYGWRNGYSQWQQSRRCRTWYATGGACVAGNASLAEEKCGGVQDGYEFLVMHRYLLQTIKALSPELESGLSVWRKFPSVENYPEEIQHRVHPWPDEILRAARIVDTITKAKAEQIALRWPTEGDFGRWLQCGRDDSPGINTLYSALLTNAIDIAADNSGAQPHILDLHLFWQAHSWVDLVWEKYRRAMGKMPDEPQLQAALIQQCRQFQFWVRQPLASDKPPEIQAAALYKNGHLNPHYGGRLARVMGQVEEIKADENGRLFLRIDPRLLGIRHLWISSAMPLKVDSIKVGDRFTFIGTVITKEQLHKVAAVDFIQSPTLMFATAMQSIK